MSSSSATTNHTPTPWMLGRGMLNEIFAVDPANPHSVDSTDALHVATVQRRAGKSVAQSHADAAFIVGACNAHEQLVTALNKIASGPDFEAALVAQKALDAVGLRPGA